MISVSSAVSVCSGAGGAGGCTGAVCGLAESAFASSGTDAPALSLAAGSRAIAAGITYYMGAHKIMAGITFEHQMADNQYMRNGSGYYRYNLTDDMYVGGVLQPDLLFNSTPEVFCLQTYLEPGRA